MSNIDELLEINNRAYRKYNIFNSLKNPFCIKINTFWNNANNTSIFLAIPELVFYCRIKWF